MERAREKRASSTALAEKIRLTQGGMTPDCAAFWRGMCSKTTPLHFLQIILFSHLFSLFQQLLYILLFHKNPVKKLSKNKTLACWGTMWREQGSADVPEPYTMALALDPYLTISDLLNTA